MRTRYRLSESRAMWRYYTSQPDRHGTQVYPIMDENMSLRGMEMRVDAHIDIYIAPKWKRYSTIVIMCHALPSINSLALLAFSSFNKKGGPICSLKLEL